MPSVRVPAGKRPLRQVAPSTVKLANGHTVVQYNESQSASMLATSKAHLEEFFSRILTSGQPITHEDIAYANEMSVVCPPGLGPLTCILCKITRCGRQRERHKMSRKHRDALAKACNVDLADFPPLTVKYECSLCPDLHIKDMFALDQHLHVVHKKQPLPHYKRIIPLHVDGGNRESSVNRWFYEQAASEPRCSPSPSDFAILAEVMDPSQYGDDDDGERANDFDADVENVDEDEEGAYGYEEEDGEEDEEDEEDEDEDEEAEEAGEVNEEYEEDEDFMVTEDDTTVCGSDYNDN